MRQSQKKIGNYTYRTETLSARKALGLALKLGSLMGPDVFSLAVSNDAARDFLASKPEMLGEVIGTVCRHAVSEGVDSTISTLLELLSKTTVTDWRTGDVETPRDVPEVFDELYPPYRFAELVQVIAWVVQENFTAP